MSFNPLCYHKPKNKNYNFYNARVVKARKDYQCFYCGNSISKGSPYLNYRKPTYDGWGSRAILITRRCCINCAKKLPGINDIIP